MNPSRPYNLDVHARFYAPALSSGARSVDLDAEEAHHLIHVLRLGAGAEVLVFNGRGLQVRARVDRVTRRAATLAVIGPAAAAAERLVGVTLAQAVLKGDRMDTVIRDATMMGVTAIVPVVTARTVVPWRTAASDGQHARWGRVAVSGAKQCGRAVVAAIGGPATLADLLLAPLPAARLILVEPEAGEPASADLARHARQAADEGAVVLVGPEGGWAENEVAEARRAGFEPWSLGPMTLRADAVPLVALAVLYHAWEPVVRAAP